VSRRAIDVSHLPEIAFGHRDPLWWGAMGLIAIEGTMVALVIATYFYVRGNFDAWPPEGFGRPLQALAAVEALVVAISAWPIVRTNQAALDGDLRRMRRWLAVATALGAVYLLLRWQIFLRMPFRWDLDAYASTVWAFLVLNTLHGLTGTLENALLLALLFKGPVEKKHLVDVHAGGFLWYFVVASWLPVYAIVFLAPGLLRR
jgi:cytochrome c oxidase subunit 3